MLKLLCVLYILGLYVSCCYVYLHHRYYFNALLRKSSSFRQRSKTLSGHRSICTRVAPMYRKEYFGYEYFVLPDVGNTILVPHKYFRVFGVVRPYTECLLLYKDDVVKTIICLEDKRYADNVLEEFRKTYRNILLIINGGVLLWQICLRYITF